LGNVEIAAVTDPSQTNRENFVSKHGLATAKQFSSHKQMLEQVRLDGIVICSPHMMHFEHAADAMQNGCHVLIEKPMACSSEEARRLVAIAERTGKVLQVSCQRHFQPHFQYIRQAIAEGVIGKLTSVTASVYQNWKNKTTGSWRQMSEISGGGMLMDTGSHIVDILLWTTGLTPVEVKSLIHQQDTSVEIDTFTSIRFAEGAVAGLNVVGAAPVNKGMHQTYVYCGDKGVIFYDNGQITVHAHGKDPFVPEFPDQLSNADKSFVDAMLGLQAVQVPAIFVLKVVELTELIYRAGGYEPL
jgi:predicted dehydrogenase